MNTKFNLSQTFLLLCLIGISFNASAQTIWESNSEIHIIADTDNSETHEDIKFKIGNSSVGEFSRWGFGVNGNLKLYGGDKIPGGYVSKFEIDQTNGILKLGITNGVNGNGSYNLFGLKTDGSTYFNDASGNSIFTTGSSHVKSYKNFIAAKGFELHNDNGGKSIISDGNRLIATHLHLSTDLNNPSYSDYIDATAGIRIATNNIFSVLINGQNNWSPLEVDDNGTFAYLYNSWLKEKLYVEPNTQIRFIKGTNENINFIELERDEDALSVNLGPNDSHQFKITNASGNQLLTVHNDNKVGIGTNNPTEALEVNGNIKASSFIADATKFPDYVFESNYQLKSISELEQYIQKHKRLPGMPSETEVIENGLNVKDVSVATVEKVEELFLYIIQLEKRIAELETQN